MIQTWWRSYFASPSFEGSPRVFWVLPSSQVHDILPLTISPQPDQTTRVIVGRSEILTPAAEEKLLSLAKESAGYFPLSHRFRKAYQNRITQLSPPAEDPVPQTARETAQH